MLTTLPLPLVSAVPCKELAPEPLVPPVGKESLEGTTRPPQNCGSLCGSPFSDLTSWGWQGNLWGSATGNLTMAEKQEGLSTTSTQILADRVYTYGAQLVTPTNIFAHLQNKVRPTRTREFGRVWKPDLDLQRRSFLAPEPSLFMPRKGAELHPYPLWSVCWP